MQKRYTIMRKLYSNLKKFRYFSVSTHLCYQHVFASEILFFKTYRFNKWAATRNFHRQRKLAEAGRLGKNASSIELSVGRPGKDSSFLSF